MKTVNCLLVIALLIPGCATGNPEAEHKQVQCAQGGGCLSVTVKQLQSALDRAMEMGYRVGHTRGDQRCTRDL